ncbi:MULTISPECIES: TetR/AcrR family transcriptional regulator [Thalassospira]|jgi:AcrR family transcriptional regulator|uniref:TetR family transcriptional regulator n=1 Tax=Thalassospira profundimaris TaxID=502049 RepID=A0A367VFL2_9PROT|nr:MULTISPECIES: TetR/AcrR family transcriptional regulator [Thalassospira]MBR9900864.1 TetR/AcrR family transcriptional regulator [Rhodospirillales bacterium]KZB70098.1 TetR family transcriptional regulator [Thalassospira sp. MCCC 1A01148]MBO6807819.1 TetR/AcrR family transcriptional regulator [Thalassospira sp.]MBO6840971.1 TetR/AcrR family transcriptional regulator [Thalassospira sp.]RCK23222.1 TetR family transcriptional regulator [Thalassospira profundimaris]|tara:strand:+ start:557 stop:1165 length:609 start_codon:yes stop_codon:yes gene_type:complete
MGKYHHGDVRNVLLQQAENILIDEGPAGLSLRRLARLTGVSEAAPYRHFDGKDGILAAVAIAAFERFAEQLETAAASTENHEERIMALGAAYVQFAVENPQHFRLIFGRERPPLDQYPELRDAADNAFDVLQRAVTSVDRKAEMTLAEAASAYNRALAAWSRAHGIAMLVIDGMIVPPADQDLSGFVLGLLAEDLTIPANAE